jgi:outer membrane protein assembly factor BamB
MPETHRRALGASFRAACACIPALLLTAHTATALSATSQSAAPGSPQSSPASDPSADPASVQPPKSAREILDERYVMGPTASDEFGYRIAWQTERLATRNSEAQLTVPGTDSVWFADSAGSVVRVRRENGETVWRASTFKGMERIMSIDHLPLGTDDRVYIVTQIDTVSLDALTGNLVRRSKIGQLPTTAPAVFGPYFIYGTRSGLVSWYQYGTGFPWRATTIGGTVNTQPTLAGDVVLSGSSNGTILALDAGTTRVLWDRKLSAGVETKIAADQAAAFVAGRDQSLWAFDLARGRVLWHYFTQTQLLNDPVRLADGLYLQIPDEGLVSFNPHPTDKPEGEVRWKANVPGNVIGRLGTNLLVWARSSKTFSFVDAGNGRVVAQRVLPQVMSLTSYPLLNGDLYLTAQDGRVQRAEPLARPAIPGMEAAPAPVAAPAKAPVAAPAGTPASSDS